MKQQLINLTLVLVVLVFGAFHFSKDLNRDNDNRFSVTIEQNGEKKNIENNTVVLGQGTFDIVFEFSEPMGLLVNASFSKKTFELASKNEHLDKLPGFEETGMAEGILNSEKEVFVSYNAPNYWYYDTDEQNRFNSVYRTVNGIVCKRTIESFYDTDSKTRIKVTDAEKPLYLVIVSYKRGEKITDKIEVQRQYLRIKWKK